MTRRAAGRPDPTGSGLGADPAGENPAMPLSYTLDGPTGRFVLAAEPLPAAGCWEVRVRGAAGTSVFQADDEEVARRLMMLLGEEIGMGLFES